MTRSTAFHARGGGRAENMRTRHLLLVIHSLNTLSSLLSGLRSWRLIHADTVFTIVVLI